MGYREKEGGRVKPEALLIFVYLAVGFGQIPLIVSGRWAGVTQPKQYSVMSHSLQAWLTGR